MFSGIRRVVSEGKVITSFLFLAASLIAVTAFAKRSHDDNRFCRSAANFNHHLAVYNEEKIWLGASGAKTYEIYSSQEGRRANRIVTKDATWTIAYALRDGRKCLVATGIRWEDSLDARVQKVPVARSLEDISSQEPGNPGAHEESDFVILNARLKAVDRCKNGYVLDEVLAKNPYVLGEGTVEEASDHRNEYTMSAHRSDYLFVLSSAPNGRQMKSATWAILFPLPVVDRDLALSGCTYIEAVGTGGRRLRRELRAKTRR